MLFMALVVAVPIFEVWLLIQVGHQIGVLPTIAILVAEAILGGWLLKREGGKAWKALNDALGTGRMPSGEMTNAALVLVGGVLLMLPGFASDLIGFFFLLPFTRPWARRIVGFFVARRVQSLGVNVPVMRARLRHEDLIEGEVVDATKRQRRDDTVISGEIE
ncbi:FxsA family protein [Microlunatus panaciterrae]|nr:FxsA family protein [Microlunatus panaciterrae]